MQHQQMASSSTGEQPRSGVENVLSSFASSDDNGKSSQVRVVARIRPMNQEEEDKKCISVIRPSIPEDEDKVFNSTDEPYSSSRSLSPQKTRRPFAFLTPRKKRGKEKTKGATPVIQNGPRDAVTPIQSNRQFKLAQSLDVGTSQKRRFDFDAVFDPSVSQKEVYDRAVGDAVRKNIMRGYNTTIIAYGQTGAGKTYTMGGRQDAELAAQEDLHSGESKKLANFFDSMAESDTMPKTSMTSSLTQDDGIISRAVHDLFSAKHHHESAGGVTICLTYLEIYNDELRDLLVDKSTSNSLKLRDHGDDGVMVKNLTSIEVKSTYHVKALMEEAARRRTTGNTNVNTKSSRSHAICNLIVTVKPVLKAAHVPENQGNCGNASSQLVRAKLTLVDLAGSERLKQTGVVGFRKKESININKDLFVLGKVISALADKNRAEGSLRKSFHVPYRDSKLTRLLQDSLGGNCCTVMIACVSPLDENIEESINTLRYAERTRAITNMVRQNVEKAPLSPAESAAMRRENRLLKAKIMELKKRVKAFGEERKTMEGTTMMNSGEMEMQPDKAMPAKAKVQKCDKPSFEVQNLKVEGCTVDIPQREFAYQKEMIDQGSQEYASQDEVSILTYELSLADTVEDFTIEDTHSAELIMDQPKLLQKIEADILKKQKLLNQLRDEAAILREQVETLSVQSHSLKLEAESSKQGLSHNCGYTSDGASGTSQSLDYLECASHALKMENRSENKALVGRIAAHRTTLATLEEEIQHSRLALDIYNTAGKKNKEEIDTSKSGNSKSSIFESESPSNQVPPSSCAYSRSTDGETAVPITLEELTKELRESNGKQEAELRAVKEALQIASDENVRFKEDWKSCKAENAVMSTKLEEKENVISSLMIQLDEEKMLKYKYREEVKKLSEERDVLRVKSAVQADENQRLQENSNSITNKNNEIGRLRDAMKSLQAENVRIVARLEEKENSFIQDSGGGRRASKDLHGSEEEPRTSREILGERNVQEDRNECRKKPEKPVFSDKDDYANKVLRNGILDANRSTQASDDSNLEIDCCDIKCDKSESSDHSAIRAHATKMLFWADKAIEKGRSSRSIASSVASSVGTDFMPTMSGVPPAPSQRSHLPGRPPRKIEVAKKVVVISNLDHMKNQNECSCQSSLFSGNADHVDFYLPKLGMACSCGKQAQVDKTADDGDPMAIESILRPWQAAFLKAQGITTAVELVHAQNQRGDLLAKEMRKWRKANKLVSVKTKSCGIALHIWSRTCKTIARSVREQRAEGVKNPKKPKFLEVSVPSDNRSMSTLGCGSIAEMRREYEI